ERARGLCSRVEWAYAPGLAEVVDVLKGGGETMRLRQTAMILAVVGVLAFITLLVTSAHAQAGKQYIDLRERPHTSEEIKCSLIPEACPQAQAPSQGVDTRSGFIPSPSAPPPPSATAVPSKPRPVMLKVNFATNKDSILPKDYSELDWLGDLLSSHPQIRIEITGHTDNLGSLAHNQDLS